MFIEQQIFSPRMDSMTRVAVVTSDSLEEALEKNPYEQKRERDLFMTLTQLKWYVLKGEPVLIQLYCGRCDSASNGKSK